MGEKLTAQLKASLKHQEVLEDAHMTYEQDLEAYKHAFKLYDAAYNKMKGTYVLNSLGGIK